MLKGVIFDMDGTIADSSGMDYEALSRALMDFGVEYSYDEYLRQVGARGEEIVERKTDLSREDAEKLLKKKDEYFRELVAARSLRAVEGAGAFLKELKNVPLWTALATGARLEKVNLVMEKTGLDLYFDVIITADEAGAGKPDPAVFLKAAEKLNLLPEECLVIEDAPLGIKAAHSAGMKCIALKTSAPAELLAEADLVIDSFADRRLDEYFDKALLTEH